MKENICRLCLQTINENYQEIEESLANLLKLKLDISKDTVMCTECKNNLQVLVNLNSACNIMKDRVLSLTDLKNYVNFDPVKIENTNNLKPVTELKDEIRCSFCINSTGKEGLISLHQSKEHIFMVDVLALYVPELNSSNIGELLTCETCLQGMQSVSNFLMKCLDVEEQISKYTEMVGTDDKGQIDLQDVQQFIFKPTLKFEGASCHVTELRQRCEDTREELTMKAEGVTCKIEVDDLEPFVKPEEVNIKSEESSCDSFRESSAEIKLDNDHKNSVDRTVYECDIYAYKTTLKNRLEGHTLTHKNVFKCEMCTFETKYEKHLYQHKFIHKSPSKLTMFKCPSCPLEARYERSLLKHMLMHKALSEISKFKFKCETCTFKTNKKGCLIKHKLVHENRSDITMFKCEITLYKCGSCSFETKYKESFNRHKVIHKKSSEVIMYKCDACTYETNRKYNFIQHELIHKRFQTKRQK